MANVDTQDTLGHGIFISTNPFRGAERGIWRMLGKKRKGKVILRGGARLTN